MNHKHKRPKDRRAGCLMCKPWKSNASKNKTRMQTPQEQRGRLNFMDEINKVSPRVKRAMKQAWDEMTDQERIDKMARDDEAAEMLIEDR